MCSAPPCAFSIFFWFGNENFLSIHFIYYYVNNIRRMDMDFFSCSTQYLHLYNMCNASIQLNQSRCQVIWWRFGFMLPDINIKFNLRWVFYRCDITQKKIDFFIVLDSNWTVTECSEKWDGIFLLLFFCWPFALWVKMVCFSS